MSTEASCEHCGAPASGNFCAQCGRPLGASHGAPVVLGTEGPAAPPIERIRQIPDPRKLALIGVVAFFGLAVIFELVKPSSEAEPPNEVAQTRFTSAETARVVGADGRSPWLLLAVDQEGLIRVDPSSGEVTKLGEDFAILGRSADRIFLQTRRGQVISADPESFAVDGPLQLPAPINDTQYSLIPLSFPLLSSTADHIWLRELDGSISEVNVLTGESRQDVSDAVLLNRGIVPTSPRFTSPQAGGVYRLDMNSTYQRIAEGTVLAEVPGSVLVQRCADDLGCANQWLDLEAVQETPGLHPPVFKPGALVVRPVGASAFVATRSTERVEGGNGSTIRLDRTELIDLTSGVPVDLRSAEIEPLWNDQVDISPDAELIAAVRNLELYLRGTASETSVRVEVQVRPGSTVAFIPRN